MRCLREDNTRLFTVYRFLLLIKYSCIKSNIMLMILLSNLKSPHKKCSTINKHASEYKSMIMCCPTRAMTRRIIEHTPYAARRRGRARRTHVSPSRHVTPQHRVACDTAARNLGVGVDACPLAHRVPASHTHTHTHTHHPVNARACTHNQNHDEVAMTIPVAVRALGFAI